MSKKLAKEAETIQRLLNDGSMSEKDLPLLVRHGLSQETVDYWKEHYKMRKDSKMNANTLDLIDKLTDAVSFKFKEDATSPNVTISKLKNGHYYCSVVRYTKSGGAQKKVVVCKAETADLSESVKSVVASFLKVAQTQPDPIRDLDKLANGS